jgi:lipid-A-disaccharide synthase-like uncharacterized protein
MQLSDTDKKLVERLKKRQQQFIRWRWVGLVGSILFIGVGIYAFVVLQHFAQEPALPSVMAIAFLSPVVFLLQVGGFGLLIYLVAFWRGKPETRLLLRLLEDSRDDA